MSRSRRRLLPVVAVVALAVTATTPAHAGSNLLVGVVDDSLKWSSRSRPTVAVMRHLGLEALRVTLSWQPGLWRLTRTDAVTLDRVVTGAFGMRVVLSVAGRASTAPLDPFARDQFCAYTRNALARYPTINDVVIWNEPNANDFWQPQFNADGSSAAPAAYQALLARCYDVLHAFRPSVNVISDTAPRGNDRPFAVSNEGHSPGNFIRKLGAAYRASGRDRPIFDTVGHHPYPDTSAESPFAQHPRSGSIGQGDYNKLMKALGDGFGNTAQPLPGVRGVTIWYMENGFQTTISPEKSFVYSGRENEARTVSPDWQQGAQLTDAVRLAYCQPNVGAFFNFLLVDERNLAGWQSGVLWADRTPKPSYHAFRSVIAEVDRRAVDCTAVKRKQDKAVNGKQGKKKSR